MNRLFSHFIPSWADVLYLMLLFLFGALLGSLAATGLAAVIGEGFLKYQFLVSYPLQFVPMMLYAFLKSRRRSRLCAGVALDSGHFSPFSPSSIALAVVVGTICCAVVLEPVGKLLPDMPESLKALMKALSDGPLWSTLLCTAVMAPVCEEWLCRGMLMRGFLQRMKPVWAIVLSAAFFALIHMNPWQALPAFVLGCLFGWVYYRTGSLKLTMLMHCANNAMSVLLTRLPGGEDAEYVSDFFANQTMYLVLYAACAAMLLLFLVRVRCIAPQRPDGSCDQIESKSTE